MVSNGMDSRSVVASFFARWSAQDVELAVDLAHPDVAYTFHVAAEAAPFSGVHHGPEACREMAYAILAEFDYLKYEPIILGADGDIVRAQVEFKYRHRRTGSTIEGTRRLVFEIRDGLIYRLDSFDDARRFEAFMRLTRHRMAMKPAPLSEFPKRETEGSGA